MPDLTRLINPKSVAVFGGIWAQNVISQLQKSGFTGDIWPVHPTRAEIMGLRCYSDVAALPAAPDAAFVGINKTISIDIIRELSKTGAGGAICFASGFREAGHAGLQDALVMAAGDMPVLGPNCYGLINYLDNVPLWPDQHGGIPVERGVCILAQSSNIAINLTMQRRGLPIGYMITIGNQAQTGVADLINAMTQDDRISAIGIYLEGFGDIRAFERAALEARAAGKPIVVIKTGQSEKSQLSAMSHTASLTGGGAAASAFLRRLGVIEVPSMTVFLETLKLLNAFGPILGNRLSSVSCSGGEASLMADLGANFLLSFPEFSDPTLSQLAGVLGPGVILANPLDYHTYIWGDVPKMTACFTAVMQSDMDIHVFVLDIPREDRCDPVSFECAIMAIIAAHAATQANVAILSLLPENLSETVITRFSDAGIVVLSGMEAGLQAIAAVSALGADWRDDIPSSVWLSKNEDVADDSILSEYIAKCALAEFGLAVPDGHLCESREDILKTGADFTYPLALKSLGLAHKTESGGVVLNIQDEAQLKAASEVMPDTGQGFLIETMCTDIVAELIIGVTRDATGLLVLTLGAGGILTEVLQDNVALILPCERRDVLAAFSTLKIHKILTGYRGQPEADIEKTLDAVMAVIAYVEAHKERVLELDINPLMVGPHSAVAVDALIRLREE